MPVILPPPVMRNRREASTPGGSRLFRLLFLLGLLAGACGTVWWQVEEERRTHAYDRVIREAAQRHGVPPSLVKAIIRRESKFRPWVVGRVGEVGLMQITAGAVLDWERQTRRHGTDPAQLFDPRLNIEIGTWFIARARQRWQAHPDREILALSQYNAGIANAVKWSRGPLPPSGDPLDRVRFPSTRAYIKAVFDYRTQYEERSPDLE